MGKVVEHHNPFGVACDLLNLIIGIIGHFKCLLQVADPNGGQNATILRSVHVSKRIFEPKDGLCSRNGMGFVFYCHIPNCVCF